MDKDVKNLAAMFERKATISKKPSEMKEEKEKPKVGKLATPSIFNAKPKDDKKDPPLSARKQTIAAPASAKKDVNELKNVFEQRR